LLPHPRLPGRAYKARYEAGISIDDLPRTDHEGDLTRVGVPYMGHHGLGLKGGGASGYRRPAARPADGSSQARHSHEPACNPTRNRTKSSRTYGRLG
jgi:hypothetical protein